MLCLLEVKKTLLQCHTIRYCVSENRNERDGIEMLVEIVLQAIVAENIEHRVCI